VQGILIPQQGVSRTPKGEAVALVVDPANKVQQRSLTLDRALGSRWFVSAGLEAGDRVIVEGSLRVRPGDEVRVVPFDDGSKQHAAAGSTPATSPN
jgi:membrane fusion protein (multidrug efflux system)